MTVLPLNSFLLPDPEEIGWWGEVGWVGGAGLVVG